MYAIHYAMGITVMWALDTLCYALPCHSYALYCIWWGRKLARYISYTKVRLGILKIRILGGWVYNTSFGKIRYVIEWPLAQLNKGAIALSYPPPTPPPGL